MRNVSLTLALTAFGFMTAHAEESPDQRFTINSAMINGQGADPVPATVLLDGRTGQGWLLAVAVDKKLQWIPVQFNESKWPSLLPPLADRK